MLNGNRRYRRNVQAVNAMLERIGIDPRRIQFVPVEHHLAHASSAYHVSGYRDAAIMSVDGVGEYCTTWFGCGEGGFASGRTDFETNQTAGDTSNGTFTWVQPGGVGQFTPGTKLLVRVRGTVATSCSTYTLTVQNAAGSS